MTDNRANEPTEAQVEAAAIAFTCETHDEWERSPEPYKEMIREDMRAALVAAQGAAPQASKKSCGPCRRGQHGCCDGNEYLRCECSQGAAQVLPSSGVDEDKLAEVIGKARTTSVRDNDGVKSFVMESNEQIARAVAEWLKGQGR